MREGVRENGTDPLMYRHDEGSFHDHENRKYQNVGKKRGEPGEGFVLWVDCATAKYQR